MQEVQTEAFVTLSGSGPGFQDALKELPQKQVVKIAIALEGEIFYPPAQAAGMASQGYFAPYFAV